MQTRIHDFVSLTGKQTVSGILAAFSIKNNYHQVLNVVGCSAAAHLVQMVDSVHGYLTK